MRMDRYNNNKDKNDTEDNIRQLSRFEKNRRIYDNAYASSTVVDFEDFFGDNKNDVETEKNDDILKVEEVFEEKNYDVEEYLKNAHNNSKPDENVRNLDNSEFKDQENEILRLIASIDEQKESEDFFGNLIGEDEDTIIEGQLTTEEFTKTTYEEFYENEVNSKKNSADGSTKLEKALSDETMAKLELEEEAINNTFQDIFKTKVVSKKRKKMLAITIFSISLFALIIVILLIIIL